MAAPAILVQFWFDLSGSGVGNWFTLDDPVRGVLDGTTYLLAGDLATDVSHYVTSIQVGRGRSRQTDEYRTGTATIELRNRDRRFDPFYAAGPYYGNLRPGKKVTLTAGGIVYYVGNIEDLSYGFDPSGQSTTTITCVDALGTLGAAAMTAWTATAGQTAGPRISAVLDRAEVNYPVTRSIGTGISTLQADVIADGDNVLQYLQLVARTDLGRLYAARDGTLVFRDRYSTVTVTGGPAAVALADDGTGIPYSAVEIDMGAEYLFTRTVVSRVGGATQQFTDTGSSTLYGVRTLALTDLLQDSDAQTYEMGLFLLGIYGTPTQRVSALTINLVRLTMAQQAQILGLDLGDVVNVTFTPNRIGPAVSLPCAVEGIDIDADATSATMTVTLHLGDTVDRQVFILDDPTWGVLDGPGVLAF
jgi:hypothetical protein